MEIIKRVGYGSGPFGSHVFGGRPIFLAPANITATGIIVTPDDPCVEGICIVDVSVTWQNTGDIEGSFVPNISINGIPITPEYNSEQLGAGSTTTHTFTISGLTKADSPYSICPDPN